MNTLWVALGGAAGSVARYHVGLLIGPRRFPWATLAVNLAGSLLLVLLMTLMVRSSPVRLALGTGVLGGFTTYSTFNHESIALAQGGEWGKAALYVTATVFGCLLAGLAGWGIAQGVR